jgi:hypothetical protein
MYLTFAVPPHSHNQKSSTGSFPQQWHEKMFNVGDYGVYQNQNSLLASSNLTEQ